MTRFDRTNWSRTQTPPRDTPDRPDSRKPPRWRGLTLGLLLAISPVAAGCTPEEIEASIESISISFEEGGAERGLAEAIFVLNHAIPIINMRLSGAFGP